MQCYIVIYVYYLLCSNQIEQPKKFHEDSNSYRDSFLEGMNDIEDLS